MLDPPAEQERAPLLLFQQVNELLQPAEQGMFVALECGGPKSSILRATPLCVLLDVLNPK